MFCLKCETTLLHTVTQGGCTILWVSLHVYVYKRWICSRTCSKHYSIATCNVMSIEKCPTQVSNYLVDCLLEQCQEESRHEVHAHYPQ